MHEVGLPFLAAAISWGRKGRTLTMTLTLEMEIKTQDSESSLVVSENFLTVATEAESNSLL